MASVEDLGVYPVQLPHASGEVCPRGLHDEVVMIVHETIGVANPLVSSHHIGKDINEVVSIVVVKEDGLPGVPSWKYLKSIDQNSILYSGFDIYLF